MDIIKKSIEEMLHEWLSGIVYGNLERMMVGVNSQTLQLGDVVVASPSVWNVDIWQMINAVADVVVVPIASGILIFALCMELISWANDQNIMRSSSDVIAQLIKFLIKLGIGVTLVLKANDITLWIFDLSAWAIRNAAGINTDVDSLTVSLEAIKKALKTADTSTLIALSFTSMLGNAGISIMGLVTRLIVTGRMIEIYIYCACGSAPYATLTYKPLSAIGTNYIKNLLALAFQGFFMFLMLGIYTVLMRSTVSSVINGSDAAGLIFEMLFISGVLCMMLLRSKSISKSIFGAQ